MCQSRYQQVVTSPRRGVVRVVDMEGIERTVSLLAFDEAAPQIGDWLIVHSGYALCKADQEEAETTIADLRSVLSHATSDTTESAEVER
jgi:hydrogenase expression/formation protein HypC